MCRATAVVDRGQPVIGGDKPPSDQK